MSFAQYLTGAAITAAVLAFILAVIYGAAQGEIDDSNIGAFLVLWLFISLVWVAAVPLAVITIVGVLLGSAIGKLRERAKLKKK